MIPIVVYIGGVSRLRERINYFKFVDGKVGDFSIDGRWVDVRETAEGGTRLRIKADDLECLDRINTKLGQDGKIIEVVVGEKEDEVILVDDSGVQIPFDVVMSALLS